jgi:hypothetical protein
MGVYTAKGEVDAKWIHDLVLVGSCVVWSGAADAPDREAERHDLPHPQGTYTPYIYIYICIQNISILMKVSVYSSYVQ